MILFSFYPRLFIPLLLGLLQIGAIYSQDSLAYKHLRLAEEFAEANNEALATKHFNKAYEFSVFDYTIQQKAMDFFFKNKDLENLEKFLRLDMMSNSNHNGKALKLYYRGIIEMKGGVEKFHDAYQSFHRAKYEIERSEFPDLDLWADILVACGYSKVVTRSLSSDGKGYYFSILRVEDFINAYTYYKKATILDPEHEIALKNLDTVEVRILNCGKELPINGAFTFETEALKKRIHQDSIKKDSLNLINQLRSINLQHLPKQIGQMISLVNNYDEIVLVMDISGSMDDPVDWAQQVSRFMVMQELSLAILKQANVRINIGAITVGGECGLAPILKSGIGENRRLELSNLITRVKPYGWTPLNRMLNEASQLFTSASNRKTVLLISDGMDSCKEGIKLCDTAVKLHHSGIDLSVFSFLFEGTSYENNFAYQIYECMTEAANGKIFYLDENGHVVERKKKEKREQFVDFTLPAFINTNRYRVIDCLCEFDWEPVRNSDHIMKQ
ncbi:vWA domain-containing protein [Portibacter marinus]|uniref:vWA domain-containing protein n=1 Tax=Portibacter marinus TaxID=2898660 RepID=UPI001F1A78CB|nr:vWA domain-containing protein [Portibacter marinus]